MGKRYQRITPVAVLIVVSVMHLLVIEIVLICVDQIEENVVILLVRIHLKL